MILFDNPEAITAVSAIGGSLMSAANQFTEHDHE